MTSHWLYFLVGLLSVMSVTGLVVMFRCADKDDGRAAALLAMPSVLLMLVLLGLMSGCSTQGAFKGLSTTAEVNKHVRQVAISHYTARCGSIARSCAAIEDRVCIPLIKCHRDANRVIATSTGLDALIAQAMAWVSADDLDKAGPVIVRIAETLARLQAEVQRVIDAYGSGVKDD